MAGWRCLLVVAAMVTGCGGAGGATATDAGAPVVPATAAPGWSDPPEAVQAARADIYGRIAEVDPRSRRVLVDGVGNKAWLTVTDATEIVALTDDGHTAAGFGDLRLGRQVSVAFTGPVRESYPVQAAAGQIIIVD